MATQRSKYYVSWDDLAVRAGLALLRKVAGYSGKDFRGGKIHGEKFEGLTEQDIVSAAASILESAGYDTYREETYPSEVESKRCDLYGQNWHGDEVYCEAKLIWDGYDNRLNKKRFEENEEILKDVAHLKKLAPSSADRLVLLACFSENGETAENPAEAKTLALGDVIRKLSEVSEKRPTWFVTDLKVVADAAHPCEYLHILTWKL